MNVHRKWPAHAGHQPQDARTRAITIDNGRSEVRNELARDATLTASNAARLS